MKAFCNSVTPLNSHPSRFGRPSLVLSSLAAMAVLVLVLGSGCKKSESATPPATSVDFASLSQAFPSPTPEVQQDLRSVQRAIQYRTYAEALTALDKLAALPDLTDAQKKAVNDTAQQVKQVQANGQPPLPAH